MMTQTRLPLNFFAIPFGLSGITGTWIIANAALGAPAAVGIALWIITAATWIALLGVYAWRGMRAGGSFLADLRHPILGPFGSLIPIVAILLGGQLASVWPVAGGVLVAVGVSLIVVISAWKLAGWLTGTIDAGMFHPGYFLTLVAGNLIGAIGLAQTGANTLALIAFGIGIFFWAVLAAVVLTRLIAIEALPTPLVPTLAIFSVPPSVAGIAWFVINGDRIDVVHQMLMGIMVFLLLSQVFLVPRYARVPFGVGYWSFTFSAAAPATYTIRWLWVTQPYGWEVWSWLLLGLVTVWIGWIAGRSVSLALAGRRAVDQ